MSKYLVKKNLKGEWRWTFIAKNGEKIAQASEGYKSKGSCEKSIELLKASASAPIEYPESKAAKAAAKAAPKAKAGTRSGVKALKAAAKAVKPATTKKTSAKKLAKA